MTVCGSIPNLFVLVFFFSFMLNRVIWETGQRETIVVYKSESSCGGESMPSGGFVLSRVETHREPAAGIDWLTGGLMIDLWTLSGVGSRWSQHGCDSVRIIGHFHGVTTGVVGEWVSEWEQHVVGRMMHTRWWPLALFHFLYLSFFTVKS